MRKNTHFCRIIRYCGGIPFRGTDKKRYFCSMENDEYLCLASASEGFYSDLRSKFMAFARPVESEDEVKTVLASLKREYHDARHIAYAYIIGEGGEAFRANDDGEPSGTAGRPILGQLRSRGLTFSMVAVVRYFGGVKLGTSRLAEAYKAAANDALGKAKTVAKAPESLLRASFDYGSMGVVMKAVRDSGGQVVESGYEESPKPMATLKIRLRKSAEADFRRLTGRIAKIEEA